MNKNDHNSPNLFENARDADFVFDLQEARSRCYDAEMFEQMREFFFVQSAEAMEQIGESITRGDMKTVAHAAHSLRGTLVYLGSPSCLEAAGCVENSSLNGDLRAASESVDKLAFQMEKLKQALRESAVEEK